MHRPIGDNLLNVYSFAEITVNDCQWCAHVVSLCLRQAKFQRDGSSIKKLSYRIQDTCRENFKISITF